MKILRLILIDPSNLIFKNHQNTRKTQFSDKIFQQLFFSKRLNLKIETCISDFTYFFIPL